MAIHVVILKRPYLRAVLRGEKTVECRLSKSKTAPYGQVAAGERLFIKYAGGPFAATALAGQVESFAGLTPDAVDQLRVRYNARVCGDPGYWQGKRDSRFATFVPLRCVEPIDVGPAYPKSPYKGWFVLDAQKSPLWDVPLTHGALRNRYLRLPGVSNGLRHQALRLEMPDGQTVQTDLTTGNRVRWRGWGPYYKARALKPGDCVRLVALAPRQYRVSFHRQADRAE